MKTVKEIIAHLENERAYCRSMYEAYREKDAEDALQYIIQAVTIESLLADIEE